MNKVSMITERKIDGFDASGNRAEWELNALKKNDFINIELIDEFNEEKVPDLSNNLIHAQQLSGRLLKNHRYIVDAHGLEFVFSSPSWTQNELQFREFSVLDVNNDGSLDIILRPFHYGTLYRNSGNCWWNVDACNGIKLNHLIWINNGNGYFDYYNDKDLTIEGLLVDSIHPYMQNETLHFVGTFSDNPSEPSVNTVDIKVNL